MKTKEIIPDRYKSNYTRYKYRLLNKYRILSDHVELIIYEKEGNRTVLKCLIDKNHLNKIKKHHWTTSGCRIPCTKIKNKTVTIGQYIGSPELRNYGKIKGQAVFDFRTGKKCMTGNCYMNNDKNTMKLRILKRKTRPYIVIIDKEDYEIINKHKWRVEKDTSGIYSVMANIDKKVEFMHRYIMKSHGIYPGNKGFRNIRDENNVFDFRKTEIYKKLLNHFKKAALNTYELIINSVHGHIKYLIDEDDIERVSKYSWVYKRNGRGWVTQNYKTGSLKRYIVGEKGNGYKYIRELKDENGRYDYRKKTLIKGLERNITQ